MATVRAVLTFSLVLLMVTIASANYTAYNSRKQLCCNGTVYDMDNNNTLTCCGNIPYNYETSICCGDGKVIDTPANKSSYLYGCCSDPVSGNTVTYEYQTQSCCNGKVIQLPNSCCGDKEEYNTETQVCCLKFTNIDNPLGSTEYRINDIADNKTACCGLDNYDYQKSVCCDDDTITPKKERNDMDSYGGCCGKEPYDYKNQVCCAAWNGTSNVGNALYDINGTANSCCGLQLFDYTTEVCCDGNKKLPKPPGADSTAWLPCCGDEVIAFPRRQICIDGKIHRRRGPTYEVCGNQQYDYRREICCNDQVYRSSSHLACCYSTTIPQVYNTHTQICCNDGVEPLTKEDLRKGNDACCAPYFYTLFG